MSPDDPRHGTIPGRAAHRKDGEEACQRCKDANALYQRRYRKIRALYGDLSVPPIGSVRRVQALMTLGWSMTQIADRVGMDQKQLWLTTRQTVVRRTTAARIATVYDALSDTEAPRVTKSQRISVGKTLAHATRNGYAPPVAWDDNIDDLTAEPYAEDEAGEVDEAVVERLLSLRNVPSTRPEKVEAMRRWLATGRSQKSFCEVHGWKQGRYAAAQRQDGAA